VGKYSNKLKLLVKTFKSSTQALFLLVFLVGLGLIIFSTAMFYAEQLGKEFSWKILNKKLRTSI
jgi:hypothetical protein